jgi:poly(A) polymerase
VANFEGLFAHGLFDELFPQTGAAIRSAKRDRELIRHAMANTALRVQRDQPVTPAFLYGALLWPPYANRVFELEVEQGKPPPIAEAQAGEEILARQQLRVAIPKRFSLPMREIWAMQPRFEQRSAARAKRLLTHPRFRAAYDFLLLRAQAGEPGTAELAQWWTQAQSGAFAPVEVVDDSTNESTGPKKRRRRRGGRNRSGGGETAPPAVDG